jgi:hypothetical protein
MVKIGDPRETDPSLQFIRGFQNYFRRRKNKLQEKELRAALKIFLQDPSYYNLTKSFADSNQDFPDIIFKDNCRVKFFVLSPYTDLKYYKGYYDAPKNQICLCTNFITDILDLKENLDRELMMAYEQKIRNKDLSDNETFACS